MEGSKQWVCRQREKIQGRFAAVGLGFEGLYQVFIGILYVRRVWPVQNKLIRVLAIRVVRPTPKFLLEQKGESSGLYGFGVVFSTQF